MTTSKQRMPSPARFVKHVIKPLLPACYRLFPPSKSLMRYRDNFGHLPNIIRPRTFNERTQRKILFDRNPRMAVFADKLRVRDYVRSRLGDDRYLTRLYAVAHSPSEIGELALPPKFVMKPNHASGMVKIVTDSSRLVPGELENLAAEWLKRDFYAVTQEWAYKNIERCVMFEELLGVEGVAPSDFKFFCFRGEPRYLYVTMDRFKGLKVNMYDLDLNLLPVKYGGFDNFDVELKAPQDFSGMLEVARKLSAGADFVRVDLYNINGRIVFGELTNCPSNGLSRFQPPEWDFKFGRYWK